MSILTPIPPSVPRASRFFYNLPVLGWMARDLAFGDAENVWYFIVILFTLIVLATMTWGLPALVMICTAYVPIHMGLMVILARP